MIPANLYVAGASGDDKYNPKYLKGQHKESKEARRARNKIAKDQKFDPEKMETTLETKRRMKKEMEDQSDSDDDGDVVMSDGDGEDENDAGDDDAAQPEKKDDPTKSSSSTNESSYASRIEMLRAKLHAKMAEKRAAAGITADAPTDATAEIDTSAPALVSKRAARRVEKRKRQEAAKQRNKKRATSVAEHKQKDQQRVVNLGGSTFNAPNSKSSVDKTTAAQDLATIDYQSLAGLKPKLDGAMDNKSLGGKKKKSLEHLLADAERKQARLKELKESGAEEDKQKAKNVEWGEAFKVAEGAKVRKTNDPKLLKKALKRKVKKKTASAKAWNVRLDQAKEAATKRQQIRTHNLDARKEGGSTGANLSSKRIKEDEGAGAGGKDGPQEKRRRQGPHANRAGFEGKKTGFINGGDKDSSGGGGGAKGKQ